MKYSLSILFIIILTRVCAQKPIINERAIKSWQWVNNPSISADGKFVAYYIENKPAGHNSLVIKSSNSSWESVFIDAKSNVYK
ncbi:MAG: hypothetical protein JKY70_22530 [Mucilaginibacter sp.]|nr:hypothetical protein [Mucilaginibacter sp.]